MSRPKIGDKIPASLLPASAKGQTTVLYFYPKDMTSGCTAEGLDFKALHSRFRRAGARVYGASRDSVASHDKFCAKHGFPFELVSDEDGALCNAFGVWVQKSLYGRKYMGIERSTFLIDADRRLRAEWRKVKVAGHARAVLDAVLALDAAPPAKRKPRKVGTRSAAGRRSRA